MFVGEIKLVDIMKSWENKQNGEKTENDAFPKKGRKEERGKFGGGGKDPARKKVRTEAGGSVLRITKGHNQYRLIMLPENCVCLLVGIEPKDTTKPKSRRKKDLLLAASEENTRDLPKAVSPQTAKLGKF